jgi:hypothetical protein
MSRRTTHCIIGLLCGVGVLLGAWRIGRFTTHDVQGLVCKERSKDFGVIQFKSAPLTHTFLLKNTSRKPIIIVRSRSSCGCTVAKLPEKPVLPGERVPIFVTANIAQALGTRDVGVALETDCTATPTVTLRVKAFIETPVEARPAQLFFGTLKPGEERTLYVRILNHKSPTPVRITGVVNRSRHLRVECDAAAKQADGTIVVGNEGTEFSLTATGANVKTEESTEVVFHTDRSEVSTLTLDCMVRHEGGIIAVPPIVIFRCANDKWDDRKEVLLTTQNHEVISPSALDILNESGKKDDRFVIDQVRKAEEKPDDTCVVIGLRRQPDGTDTHHAVIRVRSGLYMLDVPLVVLGHPQP